MPTTGDPCLTDSNHLIARFIKFTIAKCLILAPFESFSVSKPSGRFSEGWRIFRFALDNAVFCLVWEIRLDFSDFLRDSYRFLCDLYRIALVFSEVAVDSETHQQRPEKIVGRKNIYQVQFWPLPLLPPQPTANCLGNSQTVCDDCPNNVSWIFKFDFAMPFPIIPTSGYDSAKSEAPKSALWRSILTKNPAQIGLWF